MASTTTPRPIDFFIFSGELSGDRIGGFLLTHLLNKEPRLNIAAVAGPRMRKHPLAWSYPMEKFQVMGFVDVLLSLPQLRRQFYEILEAILSLNPQVVVLIDYPGFNLRMAEKLKSKGFTGLICQYVCPTVWAWKKGRIETMVRSLDLLLTLYPFEPACFAGRTLETHFVGHPLAIEKAVFVPSHFPPLVGIFPGSRKQEIARNLPKQLEAFKLFQQQHPHWSCAISVSDLKHRSLIDSLLKTSKALPSSTVLVLPTDPSPLMDRIGLAIAKSGTVVLELGLKGIPTVVCYAIKPWDLWLAQHVFKIRLPYYSLLNILKKKEVFPEFFGPHFTPENLAHALHRWASSETERALCQLECKEIFYSLLAPSPQQTAESLLLEKLHRFSP